MSTGDQNPRSSGRGAVNEILRIEHRLRGHGMWYNERGEYDPFVRNLSDGRLMSLPMPFDPMIQGMKSACASAEELGSWFTARDIQQLSLGGFAIYALSVSQFIRSDGQVWYRPAHVLSAREVSAF